MLGVLWYYGYTRISPLRINKGLLSNFTSLNLSKQLITSVSIDNRKHQQQIKIEADQKTGSLPLKALDTLCKCMAYYYMGFLSIHIKLHANKLSCNWFCHICATLTLLARLRGTPDQMCCALSLSLSLSGPSLFPGDWWADNYKVRTRLSLGLLMFQLMICPNKAFMLPTLAKLFTSWHYRKCTVFCNELEIRNGQFQWLVLNILYTRPEEITVSYNFYFMPICQLQCQRH